MTGMLFLLIRVIASPVVNVFQKKLTNRGFSPFFIVLIVYIFFSIFALIYLSITGFGNYPSAFWQYMIPLAVTDAFGNVFLIRSLKSIDLSVFGPMNAYKPVIALVLSIFLIHEMPSVPGVAGVLIIISGSYFLNLKRDKEKISFLRFLGSEGILFRFLSVFFTSVAAVLSKKVILMSSPLITLSYWSLLGLPVVYFIYRFVSRQSDHHEPVPYHQFLGLLTAFLALQIFSLYTFKFVFVGYSLALFQLSSVISVFFGSKVFKEKNIAYRYIASGIMVIGASVIILFG
jgi:drug/metabolite transporter (DMT)-like permease